jgi:CelD/BcsL family acetyltransferase involved in cellulose biosynthesis
LSDLIEAWSARVSARTTEDETNCSGLKLEKFDDWSALEQLSSQWNELVSASLSNDFFLTWEWLSCWWKAYGDAKELFVLVCSDDEGKIIGIAPLYRAELKAFFSFRTLRLIGDGTEDADNFDFIIQAGYERACIATFLDWLAANGSEWDQLELNSVPSESKPVQELQVQLAERGWQDNKSLTPRCVISLPASWDEYLEKISNERRRNWKRKLKRAQDRFEITLLQCGTQDEIEQGLHSLFQLHQNTWRARGKAGKFAVAQRRILYCSLAEQAFKNGQLYLWVLKLDGAPVAVLFALAYGKKSYGMQQGFDPDYVEYGVGTLAQMSLLKDLIERGYRYYDFLGGRDAYKLHFGAEQKTHLRLRCARPRSRFALLLAAENSASRGKEWLRQRLPAASWQMLKQAKRAASLATKRGEAS